MRMREAIIVIVGLAAMAAAGAQVPVEDLGKREPAIQRSQYEAGRAYRALQQAQYETKLAEQDYLNTGEAYRAAQAQADARKREAEAAKKALDAAKAKEARARQAYEEALKAVDQAWQKPPAKKSGP